MRYLTEQFALGALRRGATIEQFLGPVTPAGIRYVEIRAGFEVYLHLVEDNGNEHFWDVGEFGSLEEREEDEFGRLIARAEDAESALAAAEEIVGASRSRWVNEGVVQDEYGDYVLAGRPGVQAPDGYRWPAEVFPPSLTEDTPVIDLTKYLREDS